MSRAAARGAPAGRRAVGAGAAAVALALLLLLSGCGHRKPAPLQPGVDQLPPQITAVSPAPLSQFTFGEAISIWAEFTAPLDSTSATTTNVFFMIDTSRQPIEVRCSPDKRRLYVVPVGQLRLGTAYTIELSPNLRSAAGVPLGRTYSWQFRIVYTRRASEPFPRDYSTLQSPLVQLFWVQNYPGEPQPTSYEVFAGQDSAAVATRARPPYYAGLHTWCPPPPRWPQNGAPVYWTVTAVNANYDEEVDGPVWRFTPVSATAPVNSLLVQPSFSGFSYSASTGACDSSRVRVGPAVHAGIVWNYFSIREVLRSRLRLGGARLSLFAAPGEEGKLDSSRVTIWATTKGWDCAQIRLGGPPWPDSLLGPLAEATHPAPGEIRFETDALAAHLEVSARNPDRFFGYVLKSDRDVVLVAPKATDFAGLVPVLKFFYYP